jgi:recombination protein RecT
MSTTQAVSQVPKNPVKALFERPEVQAKFKELLGKRSSAFCTSVLQIVSSNKMLVNADASSVYQAAAVAATLDLPLNDNLGFAYIVPYNNKQPDGTYKVVAQFQMGYKGFVQLAQRSGQFKSIYAAPIFEGQIINENPLDGYEFDFKHKSDILIGYAAKFKLLNGYEATFYMSVDQLKKHGARYSKTFSHKSGLWSTDFDSMASKTVLKLLLSKFAPLSIEMQKAVVTDQAVINDADTSDVTYIDNEPVQIDKEAERVALMIADAETIAELIIVQPHLKPEQSELYETKFSELAEKELK